ncbi:MAG: PIG-L family deacetylase [Chryseolinea sp.]
MRRLGFLLLLIPTLTLAQNDRQPDAARIKLRLKKLNVLASALYVAAHPDDENTQIITLFSNGTLASTGYLSMTRGDGGQNLIGPEIRDELGLIRTQELLSARRIDGGKQFFTRANDFGFSKSAEEAFHVWGKDTILSDVIKVFREFQPDIIITRFPPDARAGHGHHTASAILAQEAFDAAANKDVYPEQVKQYGTWQALRLYQNTGQWWNKDINENTPGIITLNVGAYSPLLGLSYTEIAALSSSQHKSQGYGQEGIRGYEPEYLEYTKGVKASKDIFEGVNTTWSRVKNSSKVQILVDKAIREFSDQNPAATVTILLQIRKEINALQDGIWKRRKLEEVNQLIQDCAGLYIGVNADRYWASPGQLLTISSEIVNRSAVDISLKSVAGNNIQIDSTLNAALKNNLSLKFKTTHVITSVKYSDPYWLQEPHSVGRFTVIDPQMIGKGENDPAIALAFTFMVQGEPLIVTKPVIYSWVDRVKGELTRPFTVVPPVFVNLSEKVMIFRNTEPEPISVMLTSAGKEEVKGVLKMEVPQGWKVSPESIEFNLNANNTEETKLFNILAPSGESSTTALLHANAIVDGKSYDKAVKIIAYDHIPTQTLLPPATTKLVKIGLKKEGSLVGYIRGAGDESVAALKSMGYEVWEMKNDEVTPTNLKRLDAVVLGVRAMNVNDRFPFMNSTLLDYVKGGGTMIVQYNTPFELDISKYSPYPLTVSRSRVTEEDAEVRILKPDHELLSYPNKITSADFNGWVQERGLYYPSKWDPAFDALLSMNDKNEAALDGSLLIAKYGQGYYIYTGLSFFRQFPEGVSGAYRLFANMVSIGKHKTVESDKVKPKTK